MARGRSRPERRPGRQERERIPVTPGPDDPRFDDPDDGAAGVREPRRPKPLGPMSGAGERPIPEPFLAATLPDPRYDLAAR
jgi:hypothetical protein